MGQQQSRNAENAKKIFDLEGKGGYKYCPECRKTPDNPPIKTPKVKSKSIRKLMEEYENFKGSQINPYFLRRGDVLSEHSLKTGATPVGAYM